uniref:Large ribosomal subunit protein uL18c n=1 Tax=Fagus sylvatica TaxID=28930 RepID=A0A2N9EID8_FAGSY
MSSSISFLHIQSALASSQQLWMGPKLLTAASSLRPHRHPSPSLSLVVEAKARTRREDRTARHYRIRKKVEGTTERPRLCVFRSNKHLYVQVIDDTKMHTLASASTMQKPISEEFDYSSGPTLDKLGNLSMCACGGLRLGEFVDLKLRIVEERDVAKKVGEIIAKSCLEKGITKVAFDRGGYPYHGRVEALANAAREHGLQF